ncbi:MAG: hypothetical protein M3R17_03545 [Bacteroidota bacterium]|nr:hypothetical protein [Bacteroidota bacterium]
MNVVLFSGLSNSDLAIIFAFFSVIHAVLTLVFAALARAVARIFTKRRIAYWPVFLCAFLPGEACLLPTLHEDYTGAFDALPYFYLLVMIIGLTCGVFVSLKRGKKSDADKMQS